MHFYIKVLMIVASFANITNLIANDDFTNNDPNYFVSHLGTEKIFSGGNLVYDANFQTINTWHNIKQNEIEDINNGVNPNIIGINQYNINDLLYLILQCYNDLEALINMNLPSQDKKNIGKTLCWILEELFEPIDKFTSTNNQISDNLITYIPFLFDAVNANNIENFHVAQHHLLSIHEPLQPYYNLTVAQIRNQQLRI